MPTATEQALHQKSMTPAKIEQIYKAGRAKIRELGIGYNLAYLNYEGYFEMAWKLETSPKVFRAIQSARQAGVHVSLVGHESMVEGGRILVCGKDSVEKILRFLGGR